MPLKKNRKKDKKIGKGQTQKYNKDNIIQKFTGLKIYRKKDRQI